MSLHGSPRFVRYLVASLVLLGLVAITFWTGQLRPSTAHAATGPLGSLVQVTDFGDNPTDLQMWLYVPPTVKQHPAILLALHYCSGTGPALFTGTQFASLADQNGFIVIFPSVSLPPARSLQCWDVSTPAGLTRNGGGDSQGLISMISYVEQHNHGDPKRVYVTGISSGAMMTNVMLAEYPDVFKAGAAFMGVPYHCFATTDGSLWNSACANGQITMTPQQWGDFVRNADPGFSGPRPRMQLWHGTADTTLNFVNFGEEIKQWTNVMGLSQTPSFTDSPQSGWTRTRYGGTGVNAPVEGISIQGAGHSLGFDMGMDTMAIQFLGLDNISNSTPTPTPTRISTPTPSPTVGMTPTPSPTQTGGSGCSVHYAFAWQSQTGFGASFTITNTSSTAINGWTLKFSFANGQTITQLWNGSVTQSGANVTVTNVSYNASIPAGQALSSPPGFNANWNGVTNAAPTAFTLNGVNCTVV